MTTFTGASWNNPVSDLDADAYCAVCLIDTNPEGKQKVKDNCKLPIRSKPGAPVNTNALSAAAAALMGARGGIDASPADKRAAAKAIVNYERQAKMEPSDGILKLAGEK